MKTPAIFCRLLGHKWWHDKYREMKVCYYCGHEEKIRRD
jgi:hypothetical protein